MAAHSLEVIPGAPVTNKSEVTDLAIEGAFGNSGLVWGSYEELLQSNYRGPVAVRYRRPGQWCKYNVSFNSISDIVDDWVKKGALRKYVFFNQMMEYPSGALGVKIQGEISRPEFHQPDRCINWDLYYSYVNEPMRPALQKAGQHAYGLHAMAIVRYYLCPSSFEDLMTIFDKWPGAVVEFSTFSRRVGIVKGRHTNFGRNTVFWEVREY